MSRSNHWSSPSDLQYEEGICTYTRIHVAPSRWVDGRRPYYKDTAIGFITDRKPCFRRWIGGYWFRNNARRHRRYADWMLYRAWHHEQEYHEIPAGRREDPWRQL